MDDPELKLTTFDIEDFMKYQISSNQLLNIRNKKIFDNIDLNKLDEFTKKIITFDISNKNKFNKIYRQLRKEFQMVPKKIHIFCSYRQLVEQGKIKQNIDLEQRLVAKKIRALSGVLVITVLTSPSKFSCPKDCNYCPNEPGQPRSYLKDEPAVQRANRNNFDPIKQFFDRATTHFINGHPVDKIEILVLGGTWSSYPKDYQEQFIRDLYYAANIFFTNNNKFREKMSLEEEQLANENSKCRIIGLTLETRPDYITWKEIERFRKYGCTRVQLGIQHTDNEILNIINRDCTTETAIRALTMLKDCGYKIDAHFMPDLPGTTPIKDWNMFKYVLESPNLQFDQWKIYPCEITPYTKIKEWFDNGNFIPYSDIDKNLLINLIILVKNSVHPWIRLNRVIRDIPNQYIKGGNKVTNLRQHIQIAMKKEGLTCDCIRCREVRDNFNATPENAILYCRTYPSNQGKEYFLSFESEDNKTIFGFLRLRLTNNAGKIYSRPTGNNTNKKLYFQELNNCSLIRELHVYGQLVAVGDSDNKASQHYGFGKRLVTAAEMISLNNGFNKVAIISGIGVKEYYKKLGYNKEGTYVTKKLNNILCKDKIIYINYTKSNGNLILKKPIKYYLQYITPKTYNIFTNNYLIIFLCFLFLHLLIKMFLSH